MVQNKQKLVLDLNKLNIDMPQSSKEFNDRVSLSNDERTIESVNFRSFLEIIKNQKFDLNMPQSSKEFNDRVSL